MFPLLECLTALAQALGMGFANYAVDVFRQCLHIIEGTLVSQQQYMVGNNADMPDMEVPLNTRNTLYSTHASSSSSLAPTVCRVRDGSSQWTC